MSLIHQHQLANGLWLLAEPVAAAQSLALTMLLPAGSATEPQDQQGLGSLVSEMMFRGAGELDARKHSDALDQLGVQRTTSVQSIHLSLHATMIGSKLPEALPLLMNMVRASHLDAEALETSRDLSLQGLDALEDEAQEKVFVELRQRHFPQPLGRCHLGRRRDVESITLEHVRKHVRQRFVPDGTVLSFAGQFDFAHLKDLVETYLGEWHGCVEEPGAREPAPRGISHCQSESTQVHIGVAYDALPETNKQSILQHAVQALLSGGMSARLFTEVREKRGLCYAVYASYIGYRDHGVMLSYAGTTVPRAQETLEVLVAELNRLCEGFEQDEFDRAVVGMKSRLVMQGESTTARARAIAMDQYLFERPRPLDELAAKVDQITPEQLRRFVRENSPGPMTIVTIGPSPLHCAGRGPGS